jgi:aminoglycoside phosphotransferase (APT) family kinase protein
MSGTELSIEREARVYHALEKSGLPVPRLHGVARDAVLLDRMPGSAHWPTLTDPAERESVSRHFIELLARLHRLDPGELDLPGFPLPSQPEDHARIDLALWERLFDKHVGRPNPFIRFGIAWLRRNAPASVQRTALVHGDCGVGNFMFHDGRVTAMLDWEFSHFGDPVDDLGCLVLHDFVQGSDLSPHFARYRELSGIEVPRSKLLYYLAFMSLRCQVACSIALQATNRSMERGLYLSVIHSFERCLVHAIAQFAGVPLAPADLPAPGPATPHTPLYDVMLADLREFLLPALASDEVGVRRAAAIGNILVYLSGYERRGEALAERERDDVARLIGRRASDPERDARRLDELCQDPAREGELLAYLSRRSGRELALWGPALGERATRPVSVEAYL